MKTFVDIVAKYQKHLLATAIFISLCAVSVTISSNGINLNLENYPTLMILLVVVSLALIIIYINIDRYKIQRLSHQIELSNQQKDDTSLLSVLTTRQLEVYELILSGKSNKEIMTDLYIEQSTLKSHINQIYKKLNIKSRRELKSTAKN